MNNLSHKLRRLFVWDFETENMWPMQKDTKTQRRSHCFNKRYIYFYFWKKNARSLKNPQTKCLRMNCAVLVCTHFFAYFCHDSTVVRNNTTFNNISNVNCQGVVKQKYNEFSDSSSDESSDPEPFIMETCRLIFHRYLSSFSSENYSTPAL